MAKLSKFEIESYQARGYVVPNQKIPDQMLERLRQALEETIKNNPDVRPEQLASIHTSKAGPSDTKGCLLYTSPSPRDLSTSRMPSSA